MNEQMGSYHMYKYKYWYPDAIRDRDSHTCDCVFTYHFVSSFI